ncbi:MAG: DUF4388 domain-containing protein [Myxococcota bacterium]|jgi:hypothetical protein|nr:DUF4388 domain-containing protein [Myxococcota bacterium]
MSLIGSLEDLGLGDILQIIHLSQKSGVLSIRSESGEGRIVFQEGLVRLATLKGDPEDLRGLLVDRGFVAVDAFEAAREHARNSGEALSQVLSRQVDIGIDRIEWLRRECAENAVGAMFRWTTGEFSFDVGAEEQPLSSEMALSSGVNAQYLAMESLRVRDEKERSGSTPGDAPTTDEAIAVAVDPQLESEEHPGFELPAEEMFGVVDDHEPVAEVEAVAQATPVPATPASFTAPATPSPPVVVIHDSLAVLDWVRSALAPSFSGVHIFQRSQEGLGRIRQYLARAQAPILLVATGIEGSPLNGIADAADFVRRLREQSSRMQILWLRSDDEDPAALPVDLPVVTHPTEEALTESRPANQAATTLCQAVVAQVERVQSPAAASPTTSAAATNPAAADPANGDLERLKVATETLSQTSSQGEILPLVLRFASESFARVAMFMVRGEEVLGMAQRGIEAGGGPDDIEMRALRFQRDESARFSKVISEACPHCAPAGNPGDLRLATLIGAAPDVSAYIAPILSSDEVVALLYADNGAAPMPGDLSALEVVLHHAGLALDRAALERALAEPGA